MALGIGLGLQSASRAFDPAAASFFVRAGISNPTQQSAVNKLVKDLKAAAIWSKMAAIYPYVGGSAGSHAQNLVSSAYTIIWVGSLTHSSSGVKGDGASGYGKTGIIPSAAGLTLNSLHFGVYINQAETQAFGYQFGGFSGSADATSFIFISNSTGPVDIFDGFGTGTGRISGANAGTTGFFTGSRTASNSQVLYRNGTSYVSGSGASQTLPSASGLYVLAQSRELDSPGSVGGFAAARHAMFSIGTGLSAGEVTSFNTAVQTFETTLGRA
jgi:hypothetical protein